MKTVLLHLADAFVDGDRGGNRAGVVLGAEGLSTEQRQSVACQAGHSETAFVTRSRVADFRLDFHTPTQPITDCGHATVAAFGLLAAEGMIADGRSSKELSDGTVHSVSVLADSIFMAQRVATFEDLEDEASNAVRDALGLAAADLPEDLHPTVADNGLRGILVPVRSREALQRIQPNLEAVEACSKALDAIDVYAFSRDTLVPGRAACARMFAPAIGIPEEAATGMAAGRLACYLCAYLKTGLARLAIEQGWLMPHPSPSLLEAELDLKGGRLRGVRVGGRAIVRGAVRVELP